MPTRQTSSSGRPKSPRIQVVLPEELCGRLSALAEAESRTVSNMAKVLIQQGVERLEAQQGSVGQPPSLRTPGGVGAAHPSTGAAPLADARPSRAADTSGSRETARFREALERQEQDGPRRLRGAPRRLRLQRPPA